MSRHSPRRVSQSDLLIILGVVVLGCVVLGYLHGAGRKDEDQLLGGSSGFDVRSPSSASPSQPVPIRSSLSIVKLSDSEREGRPPANGAPATGAEGQPADEHLSLKETALKSGAKVSAYTADFKKAHPIMKQYSREWMSHPDLKKLNDDYMRDRDQVKFLHGLAASRSFGPLVVKIASDPSTRALVMDFVTGLASAAPADLTAAAAAVLNDDQTIHRLADNIASAVGVPSTMLSGLMGGAPAAGAKQNGAP